MSEIPVTGNPRLRIVVFQWSADHGECLDCGLPAAFYSGEPGRTERPLCAVCAANDASYGELIRRIDADDQD